MTWRDITNWRAGCGKSARPVRREGWRKRAIPTPILDCPSGTDTAAALSKPIGIGPQTSGPLRLRS